MRWLILSAAALTLSGVEGVAAGQRGAPGVVVAIPLDQPDDAPPPHSQALPPPVERRAPDGATVTTSSTAPGYDVGADYYRDRSGAIVTTQTAPAYREARSAPKRKAHRRAK